MLAVGCDLQFDPSAGVMQRREQCAALREFDPAYVSCGSQREVALFSLMSASTSSGHEVAYDDPAEQPAPIYTHRDRLGS